MAICFQFQDNNYLTKYGFKPLDKQFEMTDFRGVNLKTLF